MGKVHAIGRIGLLAPLFALALAVSFACAPAAHADDALQALQAKALFAQDEVAAGTADGIDPYTPKDEEKGSAYEYGIGAKLSNAVVTWTGGSSFAYTGKEIEPPFKATLTENGKTRTLKGSTNPNDETADFFYFYMNNVDVSKGKALAYDDQPQVVLATFVDAEPYVYVKQKTFTIKPMSLKTAVKNKSATVKVANQTYTGKALKPLPTVKYNGMTLKKGVDYTVSYKNNKKVSNKAQVIIKGMGNYSGTTKTYFKIKKASIANAKFSKVKDKTYTGSAITPNVKVKYKGKTLKKNRDYTIKYKNNKNAGIATITIKGKGNLKGTHKIQFAIAPRSITKCTTWVDDMIWTGNFRYPDVVLRYKGKKLAEGKDYTLSYSDNIEPGTNSGHVYVSAMGNFTGSRVLSFTIFQKSLDPGRNIPYPVYAWTPFKTYKYATGAALPQPYPVLTYNGRTLIHGTDYLLTDWVLDSWNGKTGTAHVVVFGYGSHFQGSRNIYYNLKA